MQIKLVVVVVLDSFVRSFVRSFVHLFILSFLHSLILSLIRGFIGTVARLSFIRDSFAIRSSVTDSVVRGGP